MIIEALCVLLCVLISIELFLLLLWWLLEIKKEKGK